MKKVFLFFFLVLICGNSGFAQAGYWQQKVDFKIEVRLDDTLHFLHGSEVVTYTNNSPDSLTFIYFHIYPNAYKNTRTAFAKQQLDNGSTEFYYSPKSKRGYIDSLSFSVKTDTGFIAADFDFAGFDDVIKLNLPEPLTPGKTIEIATPFRVKIPYVFSRLGHVRQSYQISQWYPKPAVYDASGWHQMPYLDQGEFYSEYGDYEVKITLPENYIVMGTGNIQEESENHWLQQIANDRQSTDSLSMNVTPPSRHKNKTITFKEHNIHDFAWFADKKWKLEIDTLSLEGYPDKVVAFSAYNPAHTAGWDKSIESVRRTMEGYGSKVGLYPYKTVKVVEGWLKAGGGMEYPTVTVIEQTNNAHLVDNIIVHEVGHNWFYGILGSNERINPWMDEGINSFYEGKFVEKSENTGIKKATDDKFLAYSVFGAADHLSPANMRSEKFTEYNYGVDVYYKMPLYLNYLEAYMGESSFDEAMQAYFRKWKFKHPQPADFENVFKTNSPLDVQWFFDLMKTDEMVSFTVSRPQKNGDAVKVNVTNNCSFALPVALRTISSDGHHIVQWSEPFTGTKEFVFNKAPENVSFEIDPSIPNGNIKFNTSSRKFALRPFGGLNDDSRRIAWIAPAVGYNIYDGWMAGILLHNVTLPQNKFRYILNPMYGFRSKNLAGSAVFNFSQQINSDRLDYIDYFIHFKRFGFQRTFSDDYPKKYLGYTKLAPEVVFHFSKPSYRSKILSALSVKGYFISEQQFIYDTIPGISPVYGNNVNNIYGKITYSYADNRIIDPFSYQVEGQIGSVFSKLSAEANWKFNYSIPGKGFYIRAYAGKFFKFSDNYFDTYRYQLANSFSGANDYLYDYTFGGRNEPSGFWSQQVGIREGGFKFNTPLYSNQPGLNDDYLVALNLKTDIPVKGLPVRIFCDLSKYGGRLNEGATGFLYAAGVELHLMDYLTIHIPLIMSPEYQDYKKFILGNKFFKTISFSHNLNAVDWPKLPNSFFGLN